MDPQTRFCPNEHCRDRGMRGQGNIWIHSDKEGRYRCHTCGGTFGATTGTAFFRLRTPATVVTTVLTLLAHGCPLQAIVAAFALDERTVAAWQQRAGMQCARVQTHLAQAGQVDLQHVQADLDLREDMHTPATRRGTEWGRERSRCCRQEDGGRGARVAGHGDGCPLPSVAGRRDQFPP